MTGHRNSKRPRSVPDQSSTKSQGTRKVSKKEPVVNIATSTAKDSHLCLLNEENDCDVTFFVGPSREGIPCHQLFLKARSPVFQAMFSDRWNEGTKEIKIPDIDPLTFRAFLKFLYADELVELGYDEALSLLYVAQKYDVQPLVMECEKWFRINLKLRKCVEVIQRGRAYGNENLIKMAGDIVARANSLEVIAHEKALKEMDKETLIYLLMRDDMKAKEVELFKIAVEWGKIQVKPGASCAVNEALVDIIPLIRFPIMTLNEFTTVVVPAGLLPDTTVVKIFTYFGSDDSTKNDLAKTLMFSTSPREAPLAGALVSFYEGPAGREVALEGWGSELEDYIRFRVKTPIRRGREYQGRYNSCGLTKRLAITGIIFRFPFRDDGGGSPNQDSTVPDPCDFFRVEVSNSRRALGCGHSSCESESDLSHDSESLGVRKIAAFKYEWGKEVEVKLEPYVVLNNGDNCRIKVRQVDYSPTINRYRCRSLGTLKFEELDVGCDEWRLRDVITRSKGVRIIRKIRVMEL